MRGVCLQSSTLSVSTATRRFGERSVTTVRSSSFSVPFVTCRSKVRTTAAIWWLFSSWSSGVKFALASFLDFSLLFPHFVALFSLSTASNSFYLVSLSISLPLLPSLFTQPSHRSLRLSHLLSRHLHSLPAFHLPLHMSHFSFSYSFPLSDIHPQFIHVQLLVLFIPAIHLTQLFSQTCSLML